MSPLYPLQSYIPYLRTASRELYVINKPTDQYANRVFWFLLLVLCHESDHLRARRQYLPEHLINTEYGAFGIMQCEVDYIRRTLNDMKDKPKLYGRVREWIISHNFPMFPLEVKKVLVMLQRPEGDLASIAIARLGQFRVAATIPETLPEIAFYAKQYYNTAAGKATPFDYCASTLETMKQSGMLKGA